jgi:hypothetical protein
MMNPPPVGDCKQESLRRSSDLKFSSGVTFVSEEPCSEAYWLDLLHQKVKQKET